MSLNMTTEPTIGEVSEHKEVDSQVEKPMLTASDFEPIPETAKFKYSAPMDRHKILNVEQQLFGIQNHYISCDFHNWEHFSPGDDAFRAFIKVIEEDDTESIEFLYASDTCELRISDEISLSPGQIVALAGDFYGPKKPICFGKTPEEKAQNFEAAYEALATTKSRELDTIIRRIQDDQEAIQVCFAKGLRKKISIGDSKPPLANNVIHDLVKSKLVLPGFSYIKEYATLAAENFDHFQNEARKAYEIGHNIALKLARCAFKEEDQIKKAALFVQAVTKELFACHFLTDLFSAGHLRVPRKAIYDYVEKKGLFFKSEIACLLAMKQHNEDNQAGLYVKSDKHPVPWLEIGDECYFEHDQGTNRNQKQEALVAALKDIYFAYKEDKVEPVPSAFAFLPMVAGDDERNTQPLFKLNPEDPTDLQARHEFNNPKCKQYDSNWSPALFAAKLYMSNDAELEPIQKYLESEEKEDQKSACRIC